MTLKKRLALIHRVIIPDKEYPKEYAILVTDTRSIFIHQRKTRSSFILRGETRFGTALVTDVKPKSLHDYEQTSIESLTADKENITIPHETVISLVMKTEEQKFHARDLFVWLTMKRQGHKFQVYDFEMTYHQTTDNDAMIKFYMVPLGAYFKPKRQAETRQAILREYAMDAFKVFQKVLPTKILTSEAQIASSNLQNRSFGLLLFVTILCQYSLLLNIRWFSGLSFLPLIRMNQSPSLFLDPLRQSWTDRWDSH